jgi:filamentous hemagglutinin family protein
MPTLTRGLMNSTALTNVGLVSAGLLMVSAPAMALPQGGQVIGGQATITQSSPSQLTINQGSNTAAINWNSFSIGQSETTTFVQPNAGSVAINRVTGVDPSVIEGRLNANGQVVLVNPNGMLFTKTANVNVGGLVASTSGITEKNAIAGNLTFDQGSAAGASIVNQGAITAKAGGLAALVSPSVVNNGVIVAKLGKVALASGDKWTLDLYGDRLVNFALNDQTKGEVVNSGVIDANTSGNGYGVQITANVAKDVVSNVINMSGVIVANGVAQSGGSVILEANGGNIDVSGKVASNGGAIAVSNTGGNIDVSGAIASSGAAGGNIAISADNIDLEHSSVIGVDAGQAGNGGNVTVISSGKTTFSGAITARGGKTGGNGGAIETSGSTLSAANAIVDTSAAAGNAGQWLIDPASFNIDAAEAQTIDTALAKGNVVISSEADGGNGGNTLGNITVSSGIAWAGSNTLKLSAYNDIYVNANIVDQGTGNIVLRADNQAVGAGQVYVESGKTVSTGGDVSVYYHPATYASSGSNGNAGTVTGAAGTSFYMLVDNAADLKNVSTNLAGTYAMGGDISNVGAFAPIGSVANPFTGVFDGNGGQGVYTIEGVTVTNDVDSGLFGASTGIIRNVTLDNAHVTGNQVVGALVGYNGGLLSNDEVENSIVRGIEVVTPSNSVGGLVGYNSIAGEVRDSFTTADNVTVDGGSHNIGGFVGTNYGTIVNASSEGTVTAGCNDVGGFVGANYGTINDATAEGVVSVGGGSAIGGFAGLNGTSDVSGTAYTGAIINDNSVEKIIGRGTVSYIGGFVGLNNANARIGDASATGTLTIANGTKVAGGFAGGNIGGTITDTDTAVAISAGSAVSAVGGYVGINAGKLADDIIDNAMVVTVGANSSAIGGYAGLNESGTISGICNTDTVVAGSHSSAVGGLVGVNVGSIINNNITSFVTNGVQSEYTGGLVGLNYGTVAANTVHGIVAIGGASSYEGGAIGANFGTVRNSSFTGTVTAGCVDVGGFVGGNFGTITNSVAHAEVLDQTAAVPGDGNVGGFAGFNAGTMISVAAEGSYVSVGNGNTNIGGLVGVNTGKIRSAFATGTVIAADSVMNVGGFAGSNFGTIAGGTSTDNVTVANNDTNVGGYIGLNDGSINANGVITAVNETGSTCDCTVSGVTGPVVGSGTSAVVAGDYSLNVGGYIGQQGSGTVTGVTVGNSVTVGDYGQNTGGFVGDNNGKLVNDAAINSTIVAGSNYDIGGLVGTNSGTINGGSANAVVTAEDHAWNVAGFIGGNYGKIYGGSSTGEVSVISNSISEGGFVGGNSGYMSGNTSTDTVLAGQTDVWLGGFAGWNEGTITHASYNGTVSAGSGVIAAGLLVGYNYGGKVVDSTAKGNLTVGDGSRYVGGIGWNDAGGKVAGETIIGNVTSGDNSTAVGGLVGMNGSNIDGSYNPATAYVESGSFTGNVSVGTNSFAVGGLVGWNGMWTASNGKVYYGSIADGYDPTQQGSAVSGVGTVTAGVGSTYIHDANQNGCDERAGGNCFGTAGKEIIYVNANDASSIYGSAMPNLTYYITGLAPGNSSIITSQGVVGGDVIESQDLQANVLTGNVSAASMTNVGSETIGLGSVMLNPNNANALLDYTVELAPNGGTYSVTPLAITVTANGSETYGGTNTNVSYSYSTPLIGNDTLTGLTYNLNEPATSNAGTYTNGITAVGGSNPNYKVTDAAGTFVINPADLTIIANSESTTQGTAPAPFTATFQGLVNGDSSSVVTGLQLTSAGNANSQAGQYLIEAMNAMAKNYKISYVPGTLTIQPINTPTQAGNPTPLTTPVAPLTGGSQGNLIPLVGTAQGQTTAQAASTAVFNQINQITCLKVNLEIRGVTTDSPIDCSSPLSVNGF